MSAGECPWRTGGNFGYTRWDCNPQDVGAAVLETLANQAADDGIQEIQTEVTTSEE